MDGSVADDGEMGKWEREKRGEDEKLCDVGEKRRRRDWIGCKRKVRRV